MTRYPSGQVPHDMWICCNCDGTNLIALMNEKCPVCGHARDKCCTGPNQPYPDAAGLFPGMSTSAAGASFSSFAGSYASLNTDQFDVVQPYVNRPPAFDNGAHSSGWHNASSFVYEQDVAAVPAASFTVPGCTSLAYAGTPAPGVWTCTCGATNSDLTTDFCPVCGEER